MLNVIELKIIHKTRHESANKSERNFFFVFFLLLLTTQTRVLLNNPTHLTSENCHTCTSIRITTTYVTRAQKLQTKSYNTTSKQFQLAEIIFSFFLSTDHTTCRATVGWWANQERTRAGRAKRL